MKYKNFNKVFCWCKWAIILLFICVMFNETSAQNDRWINYDGTLRPYWKIGKNAGEIRWSNASTLYYLKYNKIGGGVDSTYFVYTKNPINVRFDSTVTFTNWLNFGTSGQFFVPVKSGSLSYAGTMRYYNNKYYGLDGSGEFEFIKSTGNQTIAGTKTFSSTIAGSITGNAGGGALYSTVSSESMSASAHYLIFATGTGSQNVSLKADNVNALYYTPSTQTLTVANLAGNASTVTNGVYTSGSYANPAWITGLAWSKISTTPTTLAGYGITDAVSLSGNNTYTGTNTYNNWLNFGTTGQFFVPAKSGSLSYAGTMRYYANKYYGMDGTGEKEFAFLSDNNTWTGTNSFSNDASFTDDIKVPWESATIDGFYQIALDGKASVTVNPTGGSTYLDAVSGSPTDGQTVTIMNIHSSNTVTIRESGGYFRMPGTTLVLGQYDTATFRYYAGAGEWICIAYTDN